MCQTSFHTKLLTLPAAYPMLTDMQFTRPHSSALYMGVCVYVCSRVQKSCSALETGMSDRSRAVIILDLTVTHTHTHTHRQRIGVLALVLEKYV